MTAQTLAPETRAVLNAAYRVGAALGRKFETTDLTSELRQAARMYAATYAGDFAYMVQMRDAVAGNGAFLTDGQSRGALNCLMADARRRLAAKAPAAAIELLKTVPDGRYRVTLADGADIALRILTDKNFGMPATTVRVVSTRINGDEWMGVAHIPTAGDLRLWRSCTGALRARVADAVNVLNQAKDQNGWLVAGLAFAREGSECFICGRALDTPESLTAGYGPTCAEKNGLPWGAKASPPTAPAVEEETEDELLELVQQTAPARETADKKYARFIERSDQNRARAKAEGRSRTYEEIFEIED